MCVCERFFLNKSQKHGDVIKAPIYPIVVVVGVVAAVYL